MANNIWTDLESIHRRKTQVVFRNGIRVEGLTARRNRSIRHISIFCSLCTLFRPPPTRTAFKP